MFLSALHYLTIVFSGVITCLYIVVTPTDVGEYGTSNHNNYTGICHG